MNCWKSINISRDYGSTRLSLISFSSIIGFFLFFYLLLSSIIPTPPYMEYGVLPLLIGIPVLFIVHKLLHCVPIWMIGKKAKIEWAKTNRIPKLFCHIIEPLPRNVCLISTLFPVFIITFICCVGAYLSPAHLHYFSILASVNFGLSVYDILYAMQVTRAPKEAFISDHKEGFHILIKSNRV
ncbi:DUF3267 domain-containing protein [Alkalihalobacterium bogoriense]|uniref:DUF3267 domain-containing protein n=1 Tax=Alkalihalobacterium bogoriense TaxID=246272 RepID=UPI00047E103D|nr:DUF3267 domain-containing protein [Alkalihalobacterium bogoriense]